jgi:hypothetical protein
VSEIVSEGKTLARVVRKPARATPGLSASILIRRKNNDKILLRKIVLVPNLSKSLQTTLAAEAHLAGETF